MAVEQRFDHRRRFVPHAAHLGESLCLHDVLAVDMGSADGVEHVGGLVVRWTVQPELAHGHVHIFIMVDTVADHRGCYAFRRELHAKLPGFLRHGDKEYLVDEFVDGLSHIP